ncbi:MAG: class I SAM-dependent methyltransferase [bacterium]|nr:class I SAM-dependent methyltransferase [bacterium]
MQAEMMHKENPVSRWFRSGRYSESLELLEGLAPKSILDLGCGKGHFMKLLAKKFPSVSISGCDSNPEDAAAAKKECPDAEVHYGNIMGEKLGPADLVVVLEVMEHAHSPKKLLEKITSFVKKGGHLLVSIPRPELLRWRAIWWVWSHTIGRNWCLDEHKDLTETEFMEMASEAGLTLEKRSRFFIGCISILLFRKG